MRDVLDTAGPISLLRGDKYMSPFEDEEPRVEDVPPYMIAKIISQVTIREAIASLEAATQTLIAQRRKVNDLSKALRSAKEAADEQAAMVVWEAQNAGLIDGKSEKDREAARQGVLVKDARWMGLNSAARKAQAALDDARMELDNAQDRFTAVKHAVQALGYEAAALAA